MFQDFEENRIKKLSYPNLIYDQVIDSIKDGTLKPGDPLPSESDFVKQFGVGRTSVREALASLEYLNVIMANNGKYYINDDVQSFFKKKLLYHYKIDQNQRENVFVMRRILETQSALLAAQRATANDLKFMRQLLASIGELLESGGEDSDVMEQFIAFHGSLANATHNSLLGRIFDRFKDMMFFDAESSIFTPDHFRVFYRIAQRIVKCVEDHECVKSASAMGEYLDAVERVYSRAMEGDDHV